MVLIFDLDDTLYDERTYVESGLRAVADFGHATFGWNRHDSFHFMIDVLNRQGRGTIFNQWLGSHGHREMSLVRECLRIYRHHKPRLRLDPHAQKLLPSLKDHPLYVVTDGHKVVQQKKIEALGIEHWFRKILMTHRYGLRHAKPSTYCFERIQELEKCRWRDMAYIADNPAKDFVNLNKIGVTTVRVLTGTHKIGVTTVRVLTGTHRATRAPKGYDANYTISNLSHLRKLLSL